MHLPWPVAITAMSRLHQLSCSSLQGLEQLAIYMLSLDYHACHCNMSPMFIVLVSMVATLVPHTHGTEQKMSASAECCKQAPGATRTQYKSLPQFFAATSRSGSM